MTTTKRVRAKDLHIDWLNEQDRKGAKQIERNENSQASFWHDGTGYPLAPGHKNKEKDNPSKLAAEEMKPKAATLRGKCLETIRRFEMTADEVATTINESILSTRPRIAELAKLGEIEDTGKRRVNQSGKLATVWRAK